MEVSRTRRGIHVSRSHVSWNDETAMTTFLLLLLLLLVRSALGVDLEIMSFLYAEMTMLQKLEICFSLLVCLESRRRFGWERIVFFQIDC